MKKCYYRKCKYKGIDKKVLRKVAMTIEHPREFMKIYSSYKVYMSIHEKNSIYNKYTRIYKKKSSAEDSNIF